MSSVEIEVKDVTGHKEIKLIKIRGELNKSNSNELREKVNPHIEKGYIFFIGDLNNLRYIDSTGILQLLYLYSNVNKQGGYFRLFGVSENVRNIIHTSGADKYLYIYETIDITIETKK